MHERMCLLHFVACCVHWLVRQGSKSRALSLTESTCTAPCPYSCVITGTVNVPCLWLGVHEWKGNDSLPLISLQEPSISSPLRFSWCSGKSTWALSILATVTLWLVMHLYYCLQFLLCRHYLFKNKAKGCRDQLKHFLADFFSSKRCP